MVTLIYRPARISRRPGSTFGKPATRDHAILSRQIIERLMLQAGFFQYWHASEQNKLKSFLS